jgi:hypothetical protein
MPAISTFRVDSSMRNNIMNLCSPRRVQASICKEVRRYHQIPMLLEELLPRDLPFPHWRRLNASSREDVGDRAATDIVPRLASAPWIRR